MISAINGFCNANFTGKVKFNPKNMDKLDLELFKTEKEDLIEYAKTQKFDYTVSKQINRIFVSLEENNNVLNQYWVKDFQDRQGGRSIAKVLTTMRKMTNDKLQAK